MAYADKPPDFGYRQSIMTEGELIAARDKAFALSDEPKLEWSEFAKRVREWLGYRDECDRCGIPRRQHHH